MFIKKTAEIGYWIGEPFWNKGIATEAVKLITDYGLNHLDLIRIHTGIFEYNLSSMKVLEKCGYKKEGVFEKAIIKNGQIWNEHRYSKNKMKDEAFIRSIVEKGKEAKEKARLALSNISLEQLNWKPSAGSWSIAQCLEHLIIADSSYFSDLKEITEGTYKMSFWERYSPFTGLCGRIMKDRLQEQVKKKMIAPKIIQPQVSEKGLDLIEAYHKKPRYLFGTYFKLQKC